MITDPHLETFLAEAPIFLQPWWLEAVAPGRWDYAIVRRGEEIAAVLPYVWKKRLGQLFIEDPIATPYLGPWLRKSTAKYANRLSEEKELLTELIEALPPHAAFTQAFHPGITNWLPFFWKGFKETTRYTYHISETSNLEALWGELRENIRTDIKKARKNLVLEEGQDIETVLALHKLTCQRQGFTFNNDKEMRRLHSACMEHGCSRVIVARDNENKPHSAAWFLWSSTTVYYYMSGADPALRKSGVGSMIIWAGIEMASQMGKAFDFEGSMIEGIERIFRAFGGKQLPYFRIHQICRPYRTTAIRFLQRMLVASRKLRGIRNFGS